MKNLRVTDIHFSSYFKLVMVVSLSTGLIIGLIMFLISIFGANVYADIDPLKLNGVVAGIVNIFLAPIIFSPFGVLTSLVTYLPLKFALKLFKGIQLQLSYDNYE